MVDCGRGNIRVLSRWLSTAEKRDAISLRCSSLQTAKVFVSPIHQQTSTTGEEMPWLHQIASNTYLVGYSSVFYLFKIPVYLSEKMKHVTYLSSLFDFLRKISISLEPKRNTMHLIFLPTLKLQGTEGSQGLHCSFPRCLPHLRSGSETWDLQYLPFKCAMNSSEQGERVNKRHGRYFPVASMLTTLKIDKPETNTEWTSLKINVVGRWNFLLGQKAHSQGRAISFRKCNKCWHQEKNNKKRQSFFKSTGLFVASFQNQSWSLPLPGPAQKMTGRTRTLWILLVTLEKIHTNLKIIWPRIHKKRMFLCGTSDISPPALWKLTSDLY